MISARKTHRLHPSIPAIVFMFWWIVATLVFPDRMLNADGDLYRHIAHGDWMLSHGTLITQDPFSFTRFGEPFVAFEYGSQLIYALVFRLGGLVGVAIFAGALIATTYALLAQMLLRRGVDALLAYLTSVAAALVGAVHWVARPHLISLVLLVVLLTLLEPRPAEEALPGPKQLGRLALVSLGFFALWANLHGGFIYGLILVALYFLGSAVEWLSQRDERRAWTPRVTRYLVMGAAGGLGSLLTPHGLALYRHMLAIAQDSYLLNHTQEFLSPDFHTSSGLLLLAALAVVMTVLAFAPSRPDWRRLLLALAMLYLALTARRNMPLLAITVFPTLALHLDPAWRAGRLWSRLRATFNRVAADGTTWTWVGAMAVLFLLLGAAGGRIGSWQAIPASPSSATFPIAVVERARAAGHTGRLFHDFIWGGYLVFAWPEQKVFIDGGTDFYGNEIFFTYINTTERGWGWRDSLARWRIDRILVPISSTFARELLAFGGWALGDCDRTAVMIELAERDAGLGADGAVRALEACAGSLK